MAKKKKNISHFTNSENLFHVKKEHINHPLPGPVPAKSDDGCHKKLPIRILTKFADLKKCFSVTCSTIFLIYI